MIIKKKTIENGYAKERVNSILFFNLVKFNKMILLIITEED